MSQTKIPVMVYSEVSYPLISISHTQEIPINFLKDDLKTKSAEEAPSAIAEKTIEKEVTEPAPLANAATKIEEKTQLRGFKLFRSRLGTFVTAVAVILALTLVGTKIAGFKSFTVLSGSMEPDYPVGSMIYVKPTDYKTLKVGDVISYVANNDKTIVTHRIVDIEIDPKDSSVYRFRTKGDANASADSNLVHYKNILGTPIIVIPHLGRIVYNIKQPPGIYITLAVGTLLLAWTFLPGTLEERRKTARKSIV